MKTVSLKDIKNAKWVIPAGIAVLGFAAVAVGQNAAQNSKAAVTTTNSVDSIQSSESPAPTVKPKITVNGTEIPTDKNGTTEVPVGGGKAQVEVSDGHTRVTTSDSGPSGDTSNKTAGDVHVNVNQQSNNGSGSGSTWVNSYSSNNGSSSYNSTQVFSSGSADVNVNQ